MNFKEAFYKIFDVNEIESLWPFKACMTYGLVIFPIDSVLLNRSQFGKIKNFIKLIEEDGFWITNNEVYASEIVEAGNTQWFEINKTYNDFYNIFWSLTTHSIYSARGEWGILLNYHGFGIFGSNENLYNSFYKCYPGWEKNISDFRDYIQLEYPSLSIDESYPKHLENLSKIVGKKTNRDS